MDEDLVTFMQKEENTELLQARKSSRGGVWGGVEELERGCMGVVSIDRTGNEASEM